MVRHTQRNIFLCTLYIIVAILTSYRDKDSYHRHRQGGLGGGVHSYLYLVSSAIVSIIITY